MYKAQALQPRLLSWCAFGAGYPDGLGSRDLKARAHLCLVIFSIFNRTND